MRGELDGRDMAIATFQTKLDKAKAEIEGKDNAIANLQNQLIGVVSELLERDVAIANLRTELERAAGDKQLNLFPPEPEPTPTPEPVTASPVTEPEPTPTPKLKTKTNPKAKSNPVQEIDPESLIIPPGYKAVNSAELIEFVLKESPDSELKTKGQLTDAIRDKDTKAKGSEFSRLVHYEQAYGFKHLGKVGAKHKFLIPIA